MKFSLSLLISQLFSFSYRGNGPRPASAPCQSWSLNCQGWHYSIPSPSTAWRSVRASCLIDLWSCEAPGLLSKGRVRHSPSPYLSSWRPVLYFGAQLLGSKCPSAWAPCASPYFWKLPAWWRSWASGWARWLARPPSPISSLRSAGRCVIGSRWSRASFLLLESRSFNLLWTGGAVIVLGPFVLYRWIFHALLNIGRPLSYTLH